jgi:hypothetical protein
MTKIRKHQLKQHHWPTAYRLERTTCPFCESPNVMLYTGFVVHATCVDCGADGPIMDRTHMYPHRDAIEAWNRAHERTVGNIQGANSAAQGSADA